LIGSSIKFPFPKVLRLARNTKARVKEKNIQEKDLSRKNLSKNDLIKYFKHERLSFLFVKSSKA